MGSSTLLNVNYSGLSAMNYSGTAINQFGIVADTPSNTEYVSGTSNILRMHGHSPNPEPWCMFYTNRNDYYTDLTFDVNSAQLYDGRSAIDIWYRMQSPVMQNGLSGGYWIVIDSTFSAINWGKMLGFPAYYSFYVKSISYSFTFPAKIRTVFDGLVMSLWINDVFVDSCDYTASEQSSPGFTYPNGRIGFRNYGVWNYDFNKITYKGDRKNNSL